MNPVAVMVDLMDIIEAAGSVVCNRRAVARLDARLLRPLRRTLRTGILRWAMLAPVRPGLRLLRTGLRLLRTGLRLLRTPVWLSLAVVARAGLLGPGLRLLRTALRLLRTGPLRLLRARLRFCLRL